MANPGTLAARLGTLAPTPAPAKKVTPINQPSDGKPIMFKVDDIDENPNNPRNEFCQTALKELAASIKNSKNKRVKSPVSVKPHPTDEGRWMLNFGAMRLRATIMAESDLIPGFIDNEFTDYDAVDENDKRTNLTAMELALFIQRRMTIGETQTAIAEKLGKSNAFVSEHSSLLKMPEQIEDAYRTGKVKDYSFINKLCAAYKKHEKIVIRYLKNTEEPTRAGLKAAIEKANKPKKEPKPKPMIDGKTFKVVDVNEDIIALNLAGEDDFKRYRLVPLD